MSDDLFADLPDGDRTVMRPNPAGRAAPSRGAPALAGLDDTLPLVGLNPLVRAASPLLAAIVRLRGRTQVPNPEGLRRRIAEAVQGFETRALATGLDSKSLRAARYAICATIDDLVLSTPWGSHSVWTAQSLTSLFHNEVSGGERFFDILGKLERELGRHAEGVELMYLCLSLGFEGRYRVAARGAAELAEYREALFRALRTRRGEHERELSPHWRGAGARFRPLRARPALGGGQRRCLPGRGGLPRAQPAAGPHLRRHVRPPGRAAAQRAGDGDTGQTPWRWNAGDGSQLGLRAGALQQFELASQVRNALFPAGANAVSVKFEITPTALDASIGSVSLDIDGQEVSYSHGPTQPTRLQWPGGARRGAPHPDALNGPAVTVTKDGPWALFRLLDTARTQSAGQSDRFNLVFTGGGGSASFLVAAGSVVNPFTLPALHQFRCPAL